MPAVQLQCSDGRIHKVDLETVKCSGRIKELLGEKEDGGAGDGEGQMVDLRNNVNSVVLAKVLEWAEHHMGDPNPGPGEVGEGARGASAIGKWDEAFLDKQDPGDLFEIILAAEYLDIYGLLDITTQKVARMIKGKTVEEIRQAFGVKSDFSEGEYAQIVKENEWCEEK